MNVTNETDGSTDQLTALTAVLFAVYLTVSACGMCFTLMTVIGLTRVRKPSLTLIRLLSISDLCVATSGTMLGTYRILLTFHWHRQTALYCLIPLSCLNLSVQASFFHYIAIALDRLVAMRRPLDYRNRNHG